MHYHDEVYGSIEINEPVLIDLMRTAAMQRLHSVLQHGITGLIGITRPTTRFEHSVGVMLLVRRMGGSIEEQIAALLHDVSHTAFSHVIDYVVDGHDSQSYHEEKKEWFMERSDVPAVLARHGYDWHTFLHEENFSLLEQPAPALCADRLDYFLRDSLGLKIATADKVKQAAQHLVPYQHRIVVDDKEVARWLAYTFIAADQASWANFREVGLYELTARSIRTALKIGAITEEDFWQTDDHLWHKLKACTDRSVQAELQLISPDTRFDRDEHDPTFWVSTKIRPIDPDVLIDGHVRSLSTLDNKFARHRLAYLDSQQGKWPMRVVS